jgi:hypothetical protein
MFLRNVGWFSPDYSTNVISLQLFVLHSVQICEPEYRIRYSAWLRAGRPRGRSSSPGKVKNFLLSTLSRPTLVFTQPPIQWVPGALSSRVKRPGRESDHSPPTSAEVKKMWIYTSTPPYAYRDKFTFTLQRPLRYRGGSFPGVKRLGREADNSPLSTAEVKNGCTILPLPHKTLWRGAYLIKHWANFAFIHWYLLWMKYL